MGPSDSTRLPKRPSGAGKVHKSQLMRQKWSAKISRKVGRKMSRPVTVSKSIMVKPAEMSQSQTADFVLVYRTFGKDLETPRTMFETEMTDNGLKVEREVVGELTFLKINCPFERLAFEAERIKLEMALKDCPIYGQDSTWFHGIAKLLTTDDEVDFVSAPFSVEKMHLFANHEEPTKLFRSSLRSYLVYNILINLDIRDQWNKDRDQDGDDIISKRGLLYLLMKKAYTDNFILHDVSGDDPFYIRLKENSLQEYYENVNYEKLGDLTSNLWMDL